MRPRLELEALIFDMDGTLAETEEAHRAAFNTAFARHGLDWHWSLAEYRDLLGTAGGKERMRAYQAGLTASAQRLTEAEIAALHREKTAIYGQMLAAGQIALRPGVDALISAARAAGLKIAVATTTSLANVEALAQCCWGRGERVFDVIAAGDQVRFKKPAPDVFDLALLRLRLEPGACIAFEDSLIGLRSAKAAGLRVVVTPSIHTDDQDFSAADLVVPSLAGLAIGALARL